MRTPVTLVIGLAVGIAGSLLFQQSFPPPAGSPEEKLADTERDLARTRIQLAAAEARNPRPEPSTQQKLARGMRSIMEDIKAGREVDINDLYKAVRPAMRDLSPLFERIRRKEMQKHHEFVLQDLTREYELTPAQQEKVRAWQAQKLETDIEAYRAMNASDSVTLVDIMKAKKKSRLDDGLETVMAETLTGPDRTKYQAEHMAARVERVQAEADRRVTRLNDVVKLDNAQQDQVFAIMARGSEDFDPAMQFEGLSGETTPLPPGQSRDDAIRAVLRPDQRHQYEENRIKRRIEADKDLREIGLRLPPDWDMLADD
jgi:hypothetical protein